MPDVILLRNSSLLAMTLLDVPWSKHKPNMTKAQGVNIDDIKPPNKGGLIILPSSRLKTFYGINRSGIFHWLELIEVYV